MNIEPKTNTKANMPWAHLRLPPFPQVAVRVLKLVNNENVQLHELSDLIAADPAFASEVLTVANSVLYAPRYPAYNILQAVAVLGANVLQGLCVTVGVRAYLGKAMSFPVLKHLWHHNLACAVISEKLAIASSLDKDTAFTVGILHDIGRAALAVIQPQEYAALLNRHQGSPESLLPEERELFGWDHCETGRQMVANWNLPQEFVDAVSHHHDPRQQDAPWTIAEVAHASCSMANAIGFAAFPGCVQADYEALRQMLPAAVQERFYTIADPLVDEVHKAIHAIEFL
ncbi:HDOD domain-containing protein [Telmatobacter bradus]|uniref:HDOD domain-containing protein n=1 Tax=Telmatobacter bradus TaxID=474953 RepID=UPI003B4331C3